MITLLLGVTEFALLVLSLKNTFCALVWVNKGQEALERDKQTCTLIIKYVLHYNEHHTSVSFTTKAAAACFMISITILNSDQ
jgi:hypothetical protein